MRKKDIDGSYVKRPGVKCTSVRKEIDGGVHQGHSSLICFLDGTERLIVDENGTNLCLSDGGYRWLNYLPNSENWCMTAMYDQHGQIIEWYFDITKSNFTENGVPCMDDLFLDIVVFPSGEIIILDEDELSEALIGGEITQDEFQFAYHVCDHLMNTGILDVGFLVPFSRELLSKYDTPTDSEISAESK